MGGLHGHYNTSGNDTLTAHAGHDRLYGGKGDDTFVFVMSDYDGSFDYFSGGSGNDTLQIVVTQAELETLALNLGLDAGSSLATVQAELAYQELTHSFFGYDWWGNTLGVNLLTHSIETVVIVMAEEETCVITIEAVPDISGEVVSEGGNSLDCTVTYTADDTINSNNIVTGSGDDTITLTSDDIIGNTIDVGDGADIIIIAASQRYEDNNIYLGDGDGDMDTLVIHDANMGTGEGSNNIYNFETGLDKVDLSMVEIPSFPMTTDLAIDVFLDGADTKVVFFSNNTFPEAINTLVFKGVNDLNIVDNDFFLPT